MTAMACSILFRPTGFLSLSLLPRRQHDIMFHRCDNNDTTTTVSQFQLELQLQIAEDYDSDGWYYYCHHHNDQQHQLHEEEEKYQEESQEEIFETCYTKSIELLSQSLVMRERLLGTYHVLTGKSYYKLALVFLAMSSTRQHEGIDYEHPRAYDSVTTAAAAASTAHWLFRDSWRIFYKLHGSSHKLTQSSYRNIFVSLLTMKFPYKAARHYGTILHESMQLEEQGDITIRRISNRDCSDIGNNDDQSDDNSNNVDDNQTIDVAIKYYTKAVHLLQDDLVLLGMDGPDKAELYTKIGNCYVQRYLCHLNHTCTASREEASCTLCRKLLQCKQSLLVVVEEEEQHHDENLDSWYYKDLVTACDMYHRAIDIYSRTLGENHPATIQTIDKVKEIHHLFNATYQSKGWILNKLRCRFWENVDGWFHP